jgi:hypothetical protein
MMIVFAATTVVLPAAVILQDEVKAHLKDLVATARLKTEVTLGQPTTEASFKAAAPSKTLVHA